MEAQRRGLGVLRSFSQAMLIGMDRIIGNECRATRGRLGWSQKELAAAAGVTQTAISQLETGKKRPKAVIEAVRRAFAGASAVRQHERSSQRAIAIAAAGGSLEPSAQHRPRARAISPSRAAGQSLPVRF